MDSIIIYLIFIIPLALVLLYYLSKHNKSKLTDAGMTTFGGFWKSFFKVTGVITAIIGYVIFLHERDEKIKEMVKSDINSKTYSNSANKSNSSNDSSPTQESTIQPIVSQSEPDLNDATDSVKEFITLGKQGDADAQIRLGYMYYQGEGVTKDYDQAVNWFRKGAEQGNADAQMRLGYMYYQGEGVTKDYDQAVNWFRKGAEQGNADAQMYLGLLYYRGDAVSKDYGQAVIWFRKGAEQGNASAQNKLGLMYLHGEGVLQDYNQAFNWNRKAAEQGNAESQFTLAYMYESEVGVSKNEILAYMLYNLASVNNENYVTYRNSMAKRLSPHQLAEAQKLAVNWKAGTPLPTTTKINRKL